MNIKDLIKRLQQFDESLDVVVVGNELSQNAYFVAGVKLDKPEKVSLAPNKENMVVIFGDR